MRKVVIIVTVILVIVGILVVVFNTLLRKRMFRPAPLSSDYAISDMRQVNLESGAVFLMTNKGNKSTLVFLHGQIGNIMLYEFLVKICAEIGFDLILFDYPGFGLSRTDASYEAFVDSIYELREYVSDNIHSDVYVWGESLGGYAGTLFCEDNEQVEGLLLMSTFSHLGGVFGLHGKYCPDIIDMVAFTNLNNLEKLENIDCPVQIVHSVDDQFIDFHCATQMQSHCKYPQAIIETSGEHARPILSHQNMLDILYFLRVDSAYEKTTICLEYVKEGVDDAEEYRREVGI